MLLFSPVGGKPPELANEESEAVFFFIKAEKKKRKDVFPAYPIRAEIWKGRGRLPGVSWTY